MDRLQTSRRFRWLMILLPVMCLLLILLSLCLGQYGMSLWTSAQILVTRMFGLPAGSWEPIAERVVVNLRLPRTLTAAMVGAALTVSGAAYQGMFQNPLVSPDFLGVSSGASIGAAVAILLGWTSAAIQGLAFAGGLIAVAITFFLPKLLRSDSNIMLVLSGIIVSGLMGSIMGLIKYLADPETQLAAITYWQMGSFAYVKFSDLIPVAPTFLFGFAMLLGMSWWIDVLSLGEDEARILGANVSLVKALAVLSSTLLTASSVCISGTIGWVGLVVPHFARALVGCENKKMLPVGAFLGAAFMVTVDICARCLTPLELPVSILTGIIGAPFYGWILYQKKTQLR